MIVGERVQTAMKAAGMSQAELARRVGVAQPSIFKLIHTNKKGSVHLHRVARALGTTAAYLSGETDDPDSDAPTPPELSREEEEHLDLFRSLEPNDRAAIAQLARSLATSARSPTVHGGGAGWRAADDQR